MRTRGVNPVGLSFLDAMTCGLGAVILLFMIINASIRDNAAAVTADIPPVAGEPTPAPTPTPAPGEHPEDPSFSRPSRT